MGNGIFSYRVLLNATQPHWESGWRIEVDAVEGCLGFECIDPPGGDSLRFPLVAIPALLEILEESRPMWEAEIARLTEDEP